MPFKLLAHCVAYKKNSLGVDIFYLVLLAGGGGRGDGEINFCVIEMMKTSFKTN